MWRAKFLPILFYGISLVSFSTRATLAQTVPDHTLGSEGSTVTPDATVGDSLVDLIEGGATRGNNLFHSFSEFNVGDGSAVYFANPDGIANILTRVTGNNPSKILGILGVDGAANLFLLNPNGIVFGENAALDLNGSFLATTADSYIFNNGFEYSAKDLKAPPLLTVNIPVGLQVGINSQAINIYGKGHTIVKNVDFAPFIDTSTTEGLKVPPGNTLSLIGGNINLEDATIKLSGGKIFLGSFAEGTIALTDTEKGWDFNSQGIGEFKDINLAHKTLVEISDQSVGAIEIQAGNLKLTDGSLILANNQGLRSNSNTNINIQAHKSLELSGVAPDKFTRTGIVSQVFNNGNGGKINIFANNLRIFDGGIINNTSFGSADGGEIKIEIPEKLLVSGFAESNPSLSSAINTLNVASGNAGNLKIEAKVIEIEEGGGINSVVAGSGKGGDVFVDASQSINIKGINLIINNSSNLSSVTFGKGNAGNLNINTSQLLIQDGGVIATSTFAAGKAGNINIKASDSIQLTNSLNSFKLTNGLNSFNQSAIASDAPIATLQFQKTYGLPPIPSGDAGSVKIITPNLNLDNQAAIIVTNEGLGNAGQLEIDADNISVNNESQIAASTAQGNGGSIKLKINNLLFLQNQSVISTEARGIGEGGNITINSKNHLILLDNSQIIADAIDGRGGNIDITTQGLFVSPDSKISASSEFGLDGNVKVKNINGDRPLELDQLPDNLVDRTQQMAKTCGVGTNQFAIAGRGGLPENPLQNLRGQTVWQDLRLTAIDPSNNQSNTSQVTEYQPATSVLEAHAWKINDLGQIELIAINPNARPLDNQGSCQ